MHNVQWRPELSVGIENVDDDHKYLIELTNTLIRAIDNETSTEKTLKIFDELEAYTHYHFEREEAFMDAHCTSEEMKVQIDKHKEQHRYFVNKLPQLKEKLLQATSKSVSYEIVEFLLEWLLDHIINEDLKLSQCLNKDDQSNTSWIQRLGDKLRAKTSLHQRLWIIIALPLFFFFIQTFFITYNGYQRYSRLEEVEQITQTVINVNNVITQLQKERGLSIAYISSNYRFFKKELEEQYRKTDRTIQQVIPSHAILERYIDLDSALTQLKQLKQIRKSLQLHSMTRDAILSYYSRFVEILIHIIKETAYLPVNTIGRNTYAPILLLLHLNEIDGLIRKEGVSCITSQHYSCQTFRTLYRKKESYLTTFNFLATPELKKAIEQIEHSDTTKKIKQLQSRLLNGSLHGNEVAKQWFMLTTQKIDACKQVIEEALRKIGHDAHLQKHHFALLISSIWVIFGIIMFFIGISIYLFKESILRPLKVLTDALHNLSSGDKSIYFSTVNQKDAIGRMERAYNHLRRSLIKADYANILMELQELKTEKYAKLSEEDPLTGIANRRAFMQALRYKTEQAKKHHTPLTLLILDLDHFKKINDTYGHATGDLLLQRFVKHTKTFIRNSDIFARIGGEEFALLLPDTTMSGAYTLAEKIVHEIASLDLKDISSDLHMTVSIGISSYENGLDLAQFITKADERLYLAKHRGRNQVCCKE